MSKSTKSMENIMILISAYNEENSICKVISECQKYFRNVVVVEDGSTDMTYTKAKKLSPVEILRHPINCGQGTAIKTGIRYFLDNKHYDYLITFDGDGQHNVYDAVKMIQFAIDEKKDAVIGSRFLEEDSRRSLPMSKKTILRLARLFERVFYRIHLSDAHNGMRVLSRKSCEYLTNLSCSGMAHATEIPYILTKKSIYINDFPCSVNYKKHISKGQPIMNLLNIVSDLIQAK